MNRRAGMLRADQRERVEHQRVILRVGQTARRDDRRPRPDGGVIRVDGFLNGGFDTRQIDGVVHDVDAAAADGKALGQIVRHSARCGDDRVGAPIRETRDGSKTRGGESAGASRSRRRSGTPTPASAD